MKCDHYSKFYTCERVRHSDMHVFKERCYFCGKVFGEFTLTQHNMEVIILKLSKGTLPYTVVEEDK